MNQTTTYDGWLNVYKPKFMTSQAAVSLVRKQLELSKKIKIGHAGTLDPLAEGVLPIALGHATKLISYIVDHTKQYRFTIQFGSRTITADAEGQVIATTTSYPIAQDVTAICAKFCGRITQTPPKFSAIKIAGARAYDLARANKEFDMPTREVDILSLRCIAHDLTANIKTATYDVVCSKGTYIRSLAEDISESLHTLGFVSSLVRLSVGPFSISEAIIPAHVSNHLLLLPEIAIPHLPLLQVDEFTMWRIQQGQRLRFNDLPDGLMQIHHGQSLIAIGEITGGVFSAKRVLKPIT